MKIALASPPICPDNAQRIAWMDQLTEAAKSTDASIVCFPESKAKVVIKLLATTEQ